MVVSVIELGAHRKENESPARSKPPGDNGALSPTSTTLLQSSGPNRTSLTGRMSWRTQR